MALCPSEPRLGAAQASLRVRTQPHLVRGNGMPDGELNWTKSRASLANGACVELASTDDGVLIRHSKHPEKQIHYTRAEMVAFFAGVRNDEFDDLVEGH